MPSLPPGAACGPSGLCHACQNPDNPYLENPHCTQAPLHSSVVSWLGDVLCAVQFSILLRPGLLLAQASVSGPQASLFNSQSFQTQLQQAQVDCPPQAQYAHAGLTCKAATKLIFHSVFAVLCSSLHAHPHWMFISVAQGSDTQTAALC